MRRFQRLIAAAALVVAVGGVASCTPTGGGSLTKGLSCYGVVIDFHYTKTAAGNINVSTIHIEGDPSNDPRFTTANVDFYYGGLRFGAEVGVVSHNYDNNEFGVPASPDGQGYTAVAIHAAPYTPAPPPPCTFNTSYF